jgi:hypothetical protein
VRAKSNVTRAERAPAGTLRGNIPVRPARSAGVTGPSAIGVPTAAPL